MTGWAVFGMVMAALIVLFLLVFFLSNVKDLARYVKISTM